MFDTFGFKSSIIRLIRMDFFKLCWDSALNILLSLCFRTIVKSMSVFTDGLQIGPNFVDVPSVWSVGPISTSTTQYLWEKPFVLKMHMTNNEIS